MVKLVESVKVLVAGELKGANENFPMFRSTHEGYAIIIEEVEEAEIEMTTVKNNIGYSWDLIKGNQSATSMIKTVRSRAVLLAAEAIQVAAMCQKFIDSNLSEVNK